MVVKNVRVFYYSDKTLLIHKDGTVVLCDDKVAMVTFELNNVRFYFYYVHA